MDIEAEIESIDNKTRYVAGVIRSLAFQIIVEEEQEA